MSPTVRVPASGKMPALLPTAQTPKVTYSDRFVPIGRQACSGQDPGITRTLPNELMLSCCGNKARWEQEEARGGQVHGGQQEEAARRVLEVRLLRPLSLQMEGEKTPDQEPKSKSVVTGRGHSGPGLEGP